MWLRLERAYPPNGEALPPDSGGMLHNSQRPGTTARSTYARVRRPEVCSMPENPVELPPHVRCRRFLLSGLAPGHVVLDVGCGTGELMSEAADRGCSVEGVEIARPLVESCRAAGLRVSEGRAEHLPVPDASVDAILCSVVIPYTDERKAIAEWARVLRPGGFVNATYHGIGYGLSHLTRRAGLKERIYGLRMLANTAVYGLTGRRLPGFLGDTLCQSRGRLRPSYRSVGLDLRSEQVVETCMGVPVFLCHRLEKPLADFRTRSQMAAPSPASP
ncbi:MAG TPA: class I SAM-dependent methyltransferase [Gemmataceae bacterium]|nr:class I SAM-dependent methyltransferase [Gemmataceae bacterium]